jgi:hypothetical protein
MKGFNVVNVEAGDDEVWNELVSDLIWAIHHSAQVFKRQVPEEAYRLAWMPSGEDGYIAGEVEGRAIPACFTDRTVAELREAGLRNEQEDYLALVRFAKWESEELRRGRSTP